MQFSSSVIHFCVVNVHFFLDWSVRQHARGKWRTKPCVQIWRVILGFHASLRHNFFFFLRIRELWTVKNFTFKLHLKHSIKCVGDEPWELRPRKTTGSILKSMCLAKSNLKLLLDGSSPSDLDLLSFYYVGYMLVHPSTNKSLLGGKRNSGTDNWF